MEETTVYKAIALALLQNRDGLVRLLQKHGVNVSSNYSDRDLTIAILDVTRKSERFRSDLADLLANSVNKNQMHFTGETMFHGFTGENMFRLSGVHPPNGWYGADGARGPAPAAWKSFDGSEAEIKTNNYGVGSTTTAAPKTGSTLSTIFSGQNISNILNSGLGVLSTTLANKSNKELADTALQIEQEKTKQAALLAQSGQTAGGLPTKKGMSTGAIIGLSLLGVGAIVATVLLVRRHRKIRRAK